MVEKFRTRACQDESNSLYKRVPEFKDRVNGFLSMACCFCAGGDVATEPWEDFWHLENCGRIDFAPEEKTLFLKDNRTTTISSLMEKDAYNANITANAAVDGIVETEVFWEALLSDGWQKYLSRISQQIEKMYQKIKLEDVEKVDENYHNNWWRDNKFDEMFVYRFKYHQISPLFMLQRNINTGRIVKIRRKKVELHSEGFSLKRSRRSRLSAAIKTCLLSAEYQPSPSVRDIPKQKHQSRKHFPPQSREIAKNSGLTSKRKNHGIEENCVHYPKATDDLKIIVNFKNWETWRTQDVMRWLHRMNLNQYCRAFEEKGMTGKALAKIGKSYLVKELGMSVDHAAKLLAAIKNIIGGSNNTLVSNNSGGSSYSKAGKRKYISPQSTCDSGGYDRLDDEIIRTSHFGKHGHSNKESLIFQYRDPEESETSSVFSSMSGPAPHIQVNSLKTISDATVHSKNETFSVTIDDGRQTEARNPNLTPGCIYSLGEASPMTKSVTEDSGQLFHHQEHYRANDHLLKWRRVPDEEKIALLTIPESKFSNSQQKVVENLPRNCETFQSVKSNDEIKHNVLEEGEETPIFGLGSRVYDSFSDYSSECYNNPPKFEIAPSKKDKHREENNFCEKKLDKQVSSSRKSIHNDQIIEKNSHQTEQTRTVTPADIPSTPDFLDSSGYLKRRRCNTSSGLLQGESLRLTVGSNEDLKALFAALKATTLSFKPLESNETIRLSEEWSPDVD